MLFALHKNERITPAVRARMSVRDETVDGERRAWKMTLLDYLGRFSEFPQCQERWMPRIDS